MNRPIWVILSLALASCSQIEPKTPPPSAGHLSPAPRAATGEIPAPVSRTPILPAPVPAPPLETYTVVVHEVPVKDLLFALARDAQMNIDIQQDVTGNVTLNAVDQTLPQILERLSRQVDLRYEIDGNSLFISPDLPYLKTYTVDYVNMSRKSTSDIKISTKVASTGGGATSGGGGGSGGSDSKTDISNESNNEFWKTLGENIEAILGEEAKDNVIPNPEGGVITVRATKRQHQSIRSLIDQVVHNARRQVLIEATIVEVELNNDYQAGIDWSRLEDGRAVNLLQGDATATNGVNFLGAATAAFGAANNVPFFLLNLASSNDPRKGLSLTVKLLQEFGNTQVLSSPKLMVLNNQTSVLKVVEEQVFFEVDTQTQEATATSSPRVTVDTTIKTVPVGVTMQVTPQISNRDTVLLNVRPSISRIARFVNDPNPELTIPNLIPVIQTREIESVLNIGSGQIAVLGGLMQDEAVDDTDQVPLLGDVRGLGDLFKNRRKRSTKTELVIFLRPTVIKQPSLDGDLKPYRPFLSRAIGTEPMASGVREQP